MEVLDTAQLGPPPPKKHNPNPIIPMGDGFGFVLFIGSETSEENM